MRGGVVVSFDRAAGRIFDRARLDRVAAVAICERRVQAGGEQAVRLGAQELRPAGADPPWRRPETRTSEHVRDRGGRDADPELEQLALDTDVTPVRILPPQTHNQAARLGSKRRATLPRLALPPAQQRPVPGAQRPRTHRKARPALGREQTARSRQQRPVDSPVLRSLPTPPEDRELVSQHHDLELPLTTTPDEHPDHPAQKPVQQTHGHNAQSEPARLRSPTPPTDRNRVSLPHRHSPPYSSTRLPSIPPCKGSPRREKALRDGGGPAQA
jgi:hypothetical protein